MKFRKTFICIVFFALLCALPLSAYAVDVKEPPSNPTIELLAENADLSGAGDIIVEPFTPPHNLGGWRPGNSVAWDFSVDTEGYYTIGVLYSRPYTWYEAWGTVNIYSEAVISQYEFFADSTSPDEGDWSIYTYNDEMRAYLEPGNYRLEIMDGTADYPLYDEHFINLRSVMLVLDADEEDDESAIYGFDGKWYSYSRNMWLHIIGDAYAIYFDGYKPSDGYTGRSEPMGNVMPVEYYSLQVDLTFSPEGTLLGDWLGHFRRQEGEERDEAPIDLSANSYLGSWYCEELDETINLYYDYYVSHWTHTDIPWEQEYGYGSYEPYGNRIVLAYSEFGDGEYTLLNGGEAVYDPEAQTLTTGGGENVYTRISYGGGYKLLPSTVVRYNFENWESEYSNAEKIASEIIAVWEEYDENVDAELLNPESLIEAINNDENDETNVFIVACKVAGVNVSKYFGFEHVTTDFADDESDSKDDESDSKDDESNSNNDESDPLDVELKTQQDSTKIVLSAKDADLSEAPDVVLETEPSLSSLRSWKANNKVSFEFDISVQGYYNIFFNYTFLYVDEFPWGTINLYSEEEVETREFQFTKATSYEEYLSDYHWDEPIMVYFKPGSYRLELIPGTSVNSNHPFEDEFFINLESVSILLASEAGCDEYTLADFEGTWYSYLQEMWLKIEGDSFAMYYGDDDESDWTKGQCILENGVLSGDGLYSMTITPFGTLVADWLGHLRRQEGEEPAEAPIDLSANSYLGYWFCEELNEAIVLQYDYYVAHYMDYNAEEDIYYSRNSGNYEPYGNRIVLSRYYEPDDKKIIFNGADAIYDPDAQTLTTAGKYVYERVEYGGGKKLLPRGVRVYDWFDWGSPYVGKEKVVADIIAAWQKNGEDIDEQYLDPDNLIEAIGNNDSDEEIIFVIACEEAGVDASTYFGFE